MSFAAKYFRDSVRQSLKDRMGDFTQKVKDELIIRGHDSTGELYDSIEVDYKNILDASKGSLVMENYGVIVDRGIKRGRIPFGKRKGEKSKFVEGLTNYFIEKGLTPKRALRAAFGTAIVQRREDGMSTLESRRFSSNGKRNAFYRDIEANNLDTTVDNVIDDLVEGFVNSIIKIKV